VTFLREDVGRVPRLGQAWSKPTTRPAAGESCDGCRCLLNIDALVGDLLHVLLSEAMSDEFPPTVERRARDRFVGGNGAAINREHRRNLQLIEDLQHSPETDTVSVLVPRPIGTVRDRRL